MTGDLHQRVILDDGGVSGGDIALGSTGNPLAVGGSFDDGTSSRIARVKISQGELVKIGLNTANSTSTAVGSATSSYQTQSNPNNADATSSCVLLTVPAFIAATQAGVTIARTIYGKSIGVRFLRSSSTPVFCVEIDGVCYLVNQPIAFDDISNSALDGEAFFMIADDLADGPHSVRVIIGSDPLINAIQTLTLYGFLAERRAGYVEPAKVNDFGTPGTLTTSAVAITRTVERYVRAILYTNISGSPATITLSYSGTVVWQQALAAGASVTLDLLGLTALSATHSASVASAINFVTLGANF